jgi:drug/metabolite transporter (DMT)-like permease
MSSQRILGLILLVAGALVLAFGLNATESIGDAVSEGVTGKYTDKTTLFIVGGAAALVAGAALTFFGGGRPKLT